MNSQQPAQETVRRFEDLCKKAFEGDPKLDWVIQALGRAGFVRHSPGKVQVTQRELERILNKSARSMNGLIAMGLPVAVKGVGRRPALFDVAAVMAWDRERQAGEDLLRGPGSPALERYRLARAIEAETRNEVEQGKLCLVSQVQDDMTRWGTVLRIRFEQVARIHGKEVGDAITAAVDKAEEDWNKKLRRKEHAGKGDPQEDGNNGQGHSPGGRAGVGGLEADLPSMPSPG